MCVVGRCLTVEAFKFKHDIWTETPKISWTLQRKTKRLMLQIWTQRKSHILFLKSKACSHLGSLRVAESASLNALEVRVRDGMARWWANIGKKVMNSSDIRGKDIWCGEKKINDILLSIQRGPNEVRPYAEWLDFSFPFGAGSYQALF